MGNKLGRRHVVDEKYTRPQGLYQIKDVDYKKLRKLILISKLAPCYPGDDDSDSTLLEECPICFLNYPTLNRSRCCMKSICTECFLQMKNPSLATPTLCPFCKMSNYAVEYKGVKSKEERGQEQIEEQKVIEAKIRVRQQELQYEEEKQHKKEAGFSGNVYETRNTVASTTHRQFRNTRQNRDDEFDLDLEDLMVMEVIWLSIQENVSPSPSSPSGGFACAIAALAEQQQLSGDTNSHSLNNHKRFKNIRSKYSKIPKNLHDTAGTSGPHYDDGEDGDEEQMMLAMAVSLADAQATTSAPRVAWQYNKYDYLPHMN